MKRVVKWVCWLIGLFLVLMLIGMLWGLTPYPKPPKGVRLTPLNPPLALTDLKPDNAAYFYFKACDQMGSYTNKSSSQMDALLAGDTNTDTFAIGPTIADCREALNLVRQGIAINSCQMPWVDSPDTSTNRTKLSLLGRLLICEGKFAERAGNTDQALQNYLAVVKLGRDGTQGGPILDLLIGNGATARGTQAIRYALRGQGVSARSIAQVQSQLEQLRTSGQAYDETLRYELLSSKQMCKETFAQANGLWMTTQTRNYNHLADAAFGELIEDAKNPFWRRHSDAIFHKWSLEGRPVWTWAWNRPIARILLAMMLPPIDTPGRRAVRTDVDFQATITACALRRYELTHGKPPEQLTDLVPDLLSLVPIDPFDGKPLRYRREGSEWVIWSVGSDLKDDNAAWHEFKYQTPGEERKGGDIFFKSTEPQDDLADYLTRKASKKSS
ncbi:MAG: hypothetical protein ABSH14_16970 [Verrucomicrobiia bacterium]